ncbi:TAXI family TRAP transporter solute-binding subunit [Leucobacter aridicollis]|uniref:TAXI family TRAP transporter solute-binding subunit n=1 Tax=Leucobacter aridicollis TaxID=283878 RepID=A0A852R6R6_9MICO|nr:TAXI family TRAP transporter solute-binding subunit [Leucobacter aridicollis]NYD26608.1 hypothetical protein [Leucobacter aridicollis]
MGRRGKIWIAAAGIAALAAGALWWRGGAGPPPVLVSVGTGLPGGVYDAVGRSLAELTVDGPVRVRAVATAASVENVARVRAGELDAGFALADVAALSVQDTSPAAPTAGSEGVQDLQAVARLYDNHVHLVVRAGSPYASIGDLAGARVSLGAESSGTEVIAERLLEIAGIAVGADAGAHGLGETARLGLGRFGGGARARRDRRVLLVGRAANRCHHRSRGTDADPAPRRVRSAARAHRQVRPVLRRGADPRRHLRGGRPGAHRERAESARRRL